MKPLHQHTFQEIVDEATRQIFDGLINRGTKGMKDAIHISLVRAIDWRVACDKAKAKLEELLTGE